MIGNLSMCGISRGIGYLATERLKVESCGYVCDELPGDLGGGDREHALLYRFISSIGFAQGTIRVHGVSMVELGIRDPTDSARLSTFETLLIEIFPLSMAASNIPPQLVARFNIAFRLSSSLHHTLPYSPCRGTVFIRVEN